MSNDGEMIYDIYMRITIIHKKKHAQSLGIQTKYVAVSGYIVHFKPNNKGFVPSHPVGRVKFVVPLMKQGLNRWHYRGLPPVN